MRAQPWEQRRHRLGAAAPSPRPQRPPASRRGGAWGPRPPSRGGVGAARPPLSWRLCHLPAAGLPGEARPGNRTCPAAPHLLLPPPRPLLPLGPAVLTYLGAQSPPGPALPGRGAPSGRRSHSAGDCASAGSPGAARLAAPERLHCDAARAVGQWASGGANR